MSCWAKGLGVAQHCPHQEAQPGHSPKSRACPPRTPSSLHCQARDTAPTVPQQCRLTFGHQLRMGRLSPRAPLPDLEPPFTWVTIPATMAHPRPGRASLCRPSREKGNGTPHLAEDLISSPVLLSSDQGPRRRAEGARKGGSPTTMVTDYLYKHPEGSFLTHLLKTSHEGGRVEMRGAELGPGLHLAGRLWGLCPARLSR